MHDSDRWERLRGILEGALEREGEERARWILQACAGDGELADEVAELLGHDAPAGVLEPLDQVEIQAALDDAHVGGSVGPYVLERRIGVGGMGVVYLARRAQADFEQAVALKLIKRGMDSDDMLRRFRRERAVLAKLQHPGIARLLDGGATQDGRPWLAMEFVEGLRIDEWCRQRELSIRARIELLLAVCAAVQHAHQGLVVHRDIKPSNILVTADGSPKLLDFGIAKVLGSDGHDTSEHTLTEQRRLTPAYASPQQLAGEPVTTSCDVYSLGVVLYELLTNVRPFQTETAADRRDPPRPSALALESGGDAHGATTARLRRQLKGDLDTILLTALAPEPERRYSSVESFAADLRRYLDGLPIQARPATTAYVVSKFVRRNALAVAAGAAVLGAILVGLLVARAGYREAVDQRGLAEQSEQTALQESARARAVLDLTRSMLGGASPHDVRSSDYTLRQLLDDFDGELARTPIGDARVESSVRQIMGRAYLELGFPDRAEVHLARALDLSPASSDELTSDGFELQVDLLDLLHDRGRHAGVEAGCEGLLARIDGHAQARDFTRRVLLLRGDARVHLGRWAEAEADLRGVLSSATSDEIDRNSIEVAKGLLAKLLIETGAFEESERLSLEVLAALESGGRGASDGASNAHHNLATVLARRGRFDEAQARFERALEIERGLHGPDHPEIGVILNGLARVHSARGDFERAEALMREALAIERKAYGERHERVATALSGLGTALQGTGDLAGAEVAFRECLDIRRELFGEEHTEVARALNNLGLLLNLRGDPDGAEPLLLRAQAIRTKLYGAGHISTASILANLSGVQLALGDLDAALDSARQATAIQRDAAETNKSTLAATLVILGTAHLTRREYADARQAFEETLELLRGMHGESHPEVGRVLALQGEAVLGEDQPAVAEPLLRRAQELQRASVGSDHPALARTLQALGRASERLGREGQAEACYREALAIRRRAPADEPTDVEESGRALAALLGTLGRADEAASVLDELGLASDGAPGH